MTEKDDLLKKIKDSVIDGDDSNTRRYTEESIKLGINPIEILEMGLTPGIREIGDRFGRGEAFLPEMVLSAKAMEEAVTILEPYMGEESLKKKGKILIGTVKGDIHDIGKNIAIALLKVNGYEVIDLGTDVPSNKFLDEAKKIGAKIIGLSGLLTTSLPMMREIIEFMEEDGIREKYKVIIGGGPTSQEYADKIGADGYASNAATGVKLCDSIFGC